MGGSGHVSLQELNPNEEPQAACFRNLDSLLYLAAVCCSCLRFKSDVAQCCKQEKEAQEAEEYRQQHRFRASPVPDFSRVFRPDLSKVRSDQLA